MVGKELKLNDLIYYVDRERQRIIEYRIKSLTYEEINRQSIRGIELRKQEGEPDHIIRLGFGEAWEKRPAIEPDGTNCYSKYSNFPVYIKEEDAKNKLVEFLNQDIARLEDEKSRLQDKISDLL